MTGGLRAHCVAPRDGGRRAVGYVDAEVERHGQAVGQGLGAKGIVVCQPVGKRLEHLLALGVAEFELEQFFGGSDVCGLVMVESGSVMAVPRGSLYSASVPQ